MIKALKKRRRTAAAYRSVFMEGGRLTPEAELVLTDLAGFARFFKNVPADPLALAVVEGSRQVVRHLLESLKIQDEEFIRQMRLAVETDD
ncbi:hypothetical protein C4J81_11545 [Deltaproteobacteria bacterium Smac51]|nr:hypothetical protein C4J81_11545 [Deltaproteobacteria bacterium Smac51]